MARGLKMKLYDVIYADPPWRYSNAPPRQRDAIESHYPTMALEEIKALQIPAKKHAVLWLWTTPPLLINGIEVLQAWGFRYKTCAIWDKGKIGLGYWFRQQHELILIGQKGNKIKCPPQADRISSIIRQPRGKHSAKPWWIRDYIGRIYKGLDKIELFARTAGEMFIPEDWDYWGNEA